MVDEELLVDGEPLGGWRFRLTLGGSTYLQLSPRVRQREQSFSYASLVQHILRFLQASHL